MNHRNSLPNPTRGGQHSTPKRGRKKISLSPFAELVAAILSDANRSNDEDGAPTPQHLLIDLR